MYGHAIDGRGNTIFSTTRGITVGSARQSVPVVRPDPRFLNKGGGLGYPSPRTDCKPRANRSLFLDEKGVLGAWCSVDYYRK